MICSTLSGQMAFKHPELGILVREDGMVFNKSKGNHKTPEWTPGSLRRIKKYNYCRFETMVNGKKYLVHRLVAECFIPNPEHKPTVDHLNRDATDNRVSNLRWATMKEQVENSSKVLDCTDYGVRQCEDPVEYHKQWYKRRGKQIRDPAQHRENNKRYRDSHPGQNAEKCRKYQETHREELKARRHEHYLEHRDEINAKRRLASRAKRRVSA